MRKKLRLRFVTTAMGAFLTVVLVLLAAVNLWNYHITVSKLDDTLSLLLETSYRAQTHVHTGDGWVTVPGDSFWFTVPDKDFPSETPYTTRFFIVYCDERDRVAGVYKEYVASVTMEEAEDAAKTVLRSKKESGYLDGFRYRSEKTSWGRAMVFLNAERELMSMRELLTASGLAAAASAAALFLLTLLLSKRAVEPYVRNLEAQRRFVTDASHELKTPLTAISASTEVLELEQGENEWVRTIRVETARLTRLVGNLVALSRLDEERPFPEMTPFSLSEAVWEVAEPMGHLAEAKGKRYCQHIEENVTVTGNRTALGQLASILLDNAVRYSDENGVIELVLRREKRRVELIVYNTVAEPVEHPERLFDRFYRPDESRTRTSGGTGIGLAIAKAVCEAHGGSIRAECEGNGIFFIASL